MIAPAAGEYELRFGAKAGARRLMGGREFIPHRRVPFKRVEESIPHSGSGVRRKVGFAP